jgi:hypothetical protein
VLEKDPERERERESLGLCISGKHSKRRRRYLSQEKKITKEINLAIQGHLCRELLILCWVTLKNKIYLQSEIVERQNLFCTLQCDQRH